ncbi:MAG: response regulator with CheY-like receiver domain and winged-helix DNA-binding domain [Planctomycetota bacterium]|nr:response regulator with CheY-like receiver domain and winged-helix DNA-binding domain [Planctomycetota bacterium]
MSTALIIEDDPDQAILVSNLIALRGFRTVVAHSGREGLMRARTQPPGLILLDLMLPDTNGFDVCRRLRSDPVTRAAPIVMVTAMDNPPHRQRGYRVGANAYVTKPFAPADLYEAIKSAIQWRADLDRGKVHGEIQVELPSESSLLLEVNEFLTGLCRETPLDGEQIAQLRQSIMEMGQNAIEWGNRHRAEAIVTITYRTYEDRVEVVIRDQGSGFDPKRLPHAAGPEDPIAHMDVREKLGLREGGFGMMISRGMLDELRYNVRGNEVTLVKRFNTSGVVASR